MTITRVLQSRPKSFRHASAGIADLLRTQINARLHALFTLAVLASAALLKCNRTDWCILILAIMAVWTAEALNTAIESVCDVACSAPHPLIKRAKDVAAAGVLLSAIGAAAIGIIIFLPHLQK